MNLKPLVLVLALPLCASGRNSPVVAMLSNLNTPGPQGGGIGDLETLLPGTGFGVGFVTGGSSLTLSSVTLELYGYSPPGFHVQIYTFGPPGSVSPPRWPLVLYGELGQAAVDPRPTLWPGTTTFLDFTSSSTITLTPHSAFVIAVTEDAGGNDYNALRFGYSESYAVASDWQLYPAQYMNQWYLDPNFGGWLPSAPSGYLGMVLEVNAAPVPEPSALTFLLAASIFVAAWKVRKPLVVTRLVRARRSIFPSAPGTAFRRGCSFRRRMAPAPPNWTLPSLRTPAPRAVAFRKPTRFPGPRPF